MPNYSTPGIYVEEVSTGPRPIEAVGTSTLALLGVAPRADARVHEAVAINNWEHFRREFTAEDSESTPLAQAVFGFFDNGGRRCFVVNVGQGGSIAPAVSKGRRQGVALLEELDEVAILAAPGYADASSYDVLLSHCEKMKDRFAILDPPEDVADIGALVKVATAEVPGRRPLAAPTGGTTPEPPPRARQDALRPRSSDGGYGAFYFPWITTRDPLRPERLVNAPPSGHVAGVYARTDTLRGVHKAPANELLNGALNVTYRVTRDEQGELNQSGVNCIRYFPEGGIRIWGGRTLADSASEWRYVNVRRLFNMVEESIGRSTRWVVFEPNDYSLWKNIKRNIHAFLTDLWRSGALMGRTAEEAFFVKCDEETNPPESIDAGRVITLVGLSPVKPAEFIIFRIGQHAGGTTIESEGAAHG